MLKLTIIRYKKIRQIFKVFETPVEKATDEKGILEDFISTIPDSVFGPDRVRFILENADKLDDQEIETKLNEAGYLGEWELPVEADAATYLKADRTESYFRHTEVFEKSQHTVSFAQNVGTSGRPLWNCPGIGVVKTDMED